MVEDTGKVLFSPETTQDESLVTVPAEGGPVVRAMIERTVAYECMA